jgi:diguanylate cyclase (GGDEF)-like protein/PAS domain S-box-containing protein
VISNIRPFPGSAADAPYPSAEQAIWSRLSKLVNSIDGILWEADPTSLRFTFVSEQAERLLGFPTGDWLADGFWPAHIHPEDRKAAVEFCVEKSQGGLDHSFEYRMIAADGREVWVRDAVSVESHDGIPTALRGIIIDISAQKKAQKAIAEQFHFLWQLADAIPCPMFWKDAEGRYGGCNRAFEAYMGVTREALIGLTVYDVAPPDLARVYEEADRKLLNAQGPQVYEAAVRYADGTRHQVMFYKAAFSRQNGDIGGLVGVMLDITERKQLEALLEAKNSLLNMVLDTMPSGISVVDRDLNMILTNSRARTITGIPDELFADGQVPLETVFRFNAERGEYGPGDVDELVHVRLERAKRFEPHQFERVRPDGTIIDIRGEPLEGGGFVTIYRDITEARHAKEALARESASLRAVIEHMPQGISVFDESLTLKHWNAGFVDVIELPADLVRRDVHFDDLIRIPARRGEYGPGDPEAHVARIHALATQFLPHQFERTRPNGKTHLVCGQPLNIDGVTRGFITTYTDITERREMEEALRLSATVFERSAEGIVLTDVKARIVRVNKAFTQITGYPEKEVLGKTPAVLSSGIQGDDFYQRMWQVLADRGHWSGEIINRRRSGMLYSEHLSITRVNDSEGRPSGYIGIFSDLTESRAAERQIERLSHFDALTGLPNRALLQERLSTAIDRARQNGSQFALLTIDIDRLSHINDTLGHHNGDKLLLAVARRITGSVDQQTTVSRHAGDGYAVIVEERVADAALRELAEHLLADLQKPFQLDEHPISVNAHIGIAIYPADGADPSTLLKHADAALHHVKEDGIGRFAFFRHEMNAASMERLLIETRLRQALEREEFLLHYQPQVDVASGRITGIEALVRWQHPDMGLVSPAKFIPIAESTGQIVDLGCWVLRTACQTAQDLRLAGYGELKMAVNVSARQFNQNDFADRVRRALALTGLPPENLELELTESLILQRPDHVVETMASLRRSGITFSIDDFGTGYSSLSQLRHFPIDKLKIDQSFVRDIQQHDDGAAITQAVIALGRGLRLNVIAEGVETEAQRSFLLEHGCHAMQGYLFSRPLPLAELKPLLKTYAKSP